MNVESTFWNFLALSWSKSGGDLHCNLNGVHKHISSNFLPNVPFSIGRNNIWVIGGKQFRVDVRGHKYVFWPDSDSFWSEHIACMGLNEF